jgi:hypothetical protein
VRHQAFRDQLALAVREAGGIRQLARQLHAGHDGTVETWRRGIYRWLEGGGFMLINVPGLADATGIDPEELSELATDFAPGQRRDERTELARRVQDLERRLQEQASLLAQLEQRLDVQPPLNGK